METVAMGVVFLAITLVARRMEAFQFRWQPTRHTWVAVGTGLLAFAFSASILLVGVDSPAAPVIHYGLIYVLCGTAIPWGYTLLVERGRAGDMGLWRERWLVSLVLSIVLSALMSLIIVFEADLAAIDWRHFWRAASRWLAQVDCSSCSCTMVSSTCAWKRRLAPFPPSW